MKSCKLLSLLLTLTMLSHAAYADMQTTTGNTGSISASARLDFNIAIGKYVMLRIGNTGAAITTVNFTVDLNPALGSGNALAYTGALPTSSPSTKMSKSVATTFPATTTGVIPVAAYTNVNGTTLTCSLTLLAGTTPFNVGATSATGTPGTNHIFVTSVAGIANLQSPTGSLTGCTNGSTQNIPLLSTIGGTFTYYANFAADSVAAGSYGNIVTYVATAP